MVVRIIIFLVINFSALAIGGLATSEGVSSTWYAQLDKAPWTPPGWVFGTAWTIIMICFSIYLALLWSKVDNKKHLILLFSIQWILNVAWNPAFFYFHLVGLGIVILSALLYVVWYFLFKYSKIMKSNSLLIFPYFIWLIIAASLNAYIFFMN